MNYHPLNVPSKCINICFLYVILHLANRSACWVLKSVVDRWTCFLQARLASSVSHSLNKWILILNGEHSYYAPWNTEIPGGLDPSLTVCSPKTLFWTEMFYRSLQVFLMLVYIHIETDVYGSVSVLWQATVYYSYTADVLSVCHSSWQESITQFPAGRWAGRGRLGIGFGRRSLEFQQTHILF